MSVFDGEIDFRSTTMVDYARKDKPISPRVKGKCDNCLIVGLSRDSLKARDQPRKSPDILCPTNFEYYKDTVKRIKEEEPDLVEKYMSKDIDPVPIDHEIQDLKRTEYLVEYCSRELPFMSVNLMRRARALQTLRLPDDVYIPCTTQTGAFRHPAPEKYEEHPKFQSLRPKFDDSLIKELRRILRLRTPESSYSACHGLLGKVILEENPFGKPRKEPKFGKWRTPHYYTYYHL